MILTNQINSGKEFADDFITTYSSLVATHQVQQKIAIKISSLSLLLLPNKDGGNEEPLGDEAIKIRFYPTKD